MNTDPTGYFILMDTTIAQGIQSTIDSVIVPYFNVKKIMSWANMAVTAYDVAQQIRMIYAGEASILGLTFALAKGFIVQALITCAATAALGEAAVWVLKAVNISMDSVSFVEAVKSGDPEKIIVESLRLSISIFTLSCQCFTGETLVSTADGETRIDEIKPGDMVWSYDTEKGENVLKKVTKVKESETDVIVHVKTSDGKEINTTMFHPFMTEKEDIREWKAASNLQKGDNLITETGESVCVEEVRVEKLAEKVTVYNHEVEELHVYYVAGVLVHNICGGTSEDDIGTDIVVYAPEFAARQLLDDGMVSESALEGIVPQDVPNTFVPTNSISAGYKYRFNINGTNIEIKWHSKDLNAAKKYPGCNSELGWTAQIKVGKKLMTMGGRFVKKAENYTHISLKGDS